MNSNRIRILLDYYCNYTMYIKLKLLVFCSLEKGILEDWVFREFCMPEYRILIKILARRDIVQIGSTYL